MSDLSDLYQEVIMDHNKNPRNFREMADASNLAHGHNPLCGDSIIVYVKVDGGKVVDVAFKGSGCAISKASASLMTDYVRGRSTEDVDKAYHAFHALLTGKIDEAVASGVKLEKLEALAGVSEFPVRVKCATLSWHTLASALKDDGKTVSTE